MSIKELPLRPNRLARQEQQTTVNVQEKANLIWAIADKLVGVYKPHEYGGTGVVKQFALDMRQAFPDVTGFSHTNVKYMKQWYSFYYEHFIKKQRVVGQISHQVGGQLETAEKGHQLGGQLEMPELFGRVPWKHHVQIISNCRSLDEALFYINKVAEEGWSRSCLENQMDAKLFQAQGAATTNFSRTLPSPQGELAKEILKDPYHFGFLTLAEEHNEHELEEALIQG